MSKDKVIKQEAVEITYDKGFNNTWNLIIETALSKNPAQFNDLYDLLRVIKSKRDIKAIKTLKSSISEKIRQYDHHRLFELKTSILKIISFNDDAILNIKCNIHDASQNDFFYTLLFKENNLELDRFINIKQNFKADSIQISSQTITTLQLMIQIIDHKLSSPNLFKPHKNHSDKDFYYYLSNPKEEMQELVYNALLTNNIIDRHKKFIPPGFGNSEYAKGFIMGLQHKKVFITTEEYSLIKAVYQHFGANYKRSNHHTEAFENGKEDAIAFYRNHTNEN